METADKNLIFLSLGSNIAPRQQYVSKSIHLLKENFPDRFSVSSLYLTEPFQNQPQQAYINCAVRCQTHLQPEEVLDVITEIEHRVGRKRNGVKWESRIIDIDILLWGVEFIELPRLTIPHYDLPNRDFFLIPLLELDNTLVYPGSGIALSDLLGKIPHSLRTHPVRIAADDQAVPSTY